MTDLVPTDEIEGIVGAARHPTEHIGRRVGQTFYILHSRECLDGGVDLRECVYSVALDRGSVNIVNELAQPVYLTVIAGRLWSRGLLDV